MPGRGDNNKSGSSGQGAGNQSNQGFGQSVDHGKSGHGDKTGGKHSVQNEKSKDQASNRNTSLKKEKK